MTRTPHKGYPENLCLFLSLLDRHVYGNIKSLEQAIREKGQTDLPGVAPSHRNGGANLVWPDVH